MLFSHISDTHLGLQQYGLEEREQDIYDSFNQAIDISIKDHVDFVIFAGDIFHDPKPSGTAILQMANALKRLKQNSIESFFILGEHDKSNMRATPIPYVYHNLEFSKYVGRDESVYYKDVMIAGFDKIRKHQMSGLEEKFSKLDSLAKKHNGHRILVLHQSITEIYPKDIAAINSSDLPKNFTYYAMGHLHDKYVKEFDQLGGPVVYPGSTERTPNEKVNETEKGFFEVDISSNEAKPNWIKLDTRPHFSTKIEYEKYDIVIPIDNLLLQRKDLRIRGDREMTYSMMNQRIDELSGSASKVKRGINNRINDEFERVIDGNRQLVESLLYQNNPKYLKSFSKRMKNLKRGVRNDLRLLTNYSNKKNRYLVELNKKFSIPVASIVFILVGAPLGVMARRGNFAISGAISLGFFILYWAFLIAGENLADRGSMTPFMSMWLPNIILSILGVYLIYRNSRNRSKIKFDFINLFFKKKRSNDL